MKSGSNGPRITFEDALAEFNELEVHLGELAAYLAELAASLSHDVERLHATAISPLPDLEALLQLQRAWIARRDELIAAWRGLPQAQRQVQALPPFGAIDPSRPLV